jgi:hypothetical protein
MAQRFGGCRVKVAAGLPPYDIALREEYFSAYFVSSAMAAGATAQEAQRMMRSARSYFSEVRPIRTPCCKAWFPGSEI